MNHSVGRVRFRQILLMLPALAMVRCDQDTTPTRPGETLTLVATPIAPTFAINVTIGGGDGHGTVSMNPSGASYAPGTLVTLTAAPAAGSWFTGWTGACEPFGRKAICTVRVAGDLQVGAEFDLGSTPSCSGANTPSFPEYGFNGLTESITWKPVANATGYNLYMKTVANCDMFDNLLVTADDPVFANVQSPFDVSSYNRCHTCYYVAVTAVNGRCESPIAGTVGFMLRPCS